MEARKHVFSKRTSPRNSQRLWQPLAPSPFPSFFCSVDRHTLLSPMFPFSSSGNPGVNLGGGCRGCAPLPLRRLLTTGILQNMQICMICILNSSHYLVAQSKAFFFVFASKICLRHQSVTPFLSCAPSSTKNPGSAPELTTFKRRPCANLFRLIIYLHVNKKNHHPYQCHRILEPL